jgi:predicted bacteriocin transport accessory protein
MKINKYLLILYLVFMVSLCACSTQNNIQGKMLEISVQDIKDKIDQKETFILQFTKNSCPYCKILKNIEDDYVKNNQDTIFVFDIEKNHEDFIENQEFIYDIFKDLKTVPSVYWIEKGKPENQLPIVDENEQEYILSEWINDNKTYYQ